MACDQYLKSADTKAAAAGGLVVAAAASVGVAAVLNAGFFSAPGAPFAMVAAGAAASAAVGVLKSAIDDVQIYQKTGCCAADCISKADQLQSLLAGAATVVAAEASACYAAAGIAWIPWASQPAMQVILGAFILEIPLIATFGVLRSQLADCNAAVLRKRGGSLQEGETIADPWVLRVVYEGPGAPRSPLSLGEHEERPGTRRRMSFFLACVDLSVRTWKLEVVARVLGTPVFPLKIAWDLDGVPVPAGSFVLAGQTSTLAMTLDAGRDMTLRVTATDAAGFTRTQIVPLSLPENFTFCKGVLPLPPRDIPDIASDPPGWGGALFDVPIFSPLARSIGSKIDRLASNIGKGVASVISALHGVTAAAKSQNVAEANAR